MQALLTLEAQESVSESYHLVSDEKNRSLCGTVDTGNPFAAEVHRALNRAQAEKRGYEVCGRCESIRLDVETERS